MDKRSDMEMEELKKSLIEYIKEESKKTKCINTEVLLNRIETYNMNRENRKTLKILVVNTSKNGDANGSDIELGEIEKK